MRTLLGSLVGALVAVLGAMLWGGLAFAANIEIGFLAWGIGWAIGAIMVACGARGAIACILAACFTIGSMAGGKLYHFHLMLEQHITENVATRHNYEDMLNDARNVGPYLRAEHTKTASVAQEDDRARLFLVDHKYHDGAAEAITAEQIAIFRLLVLPDLARAAESPPSFAAWKRGRTAAVMAAAKAEIPLFTSIMASTGFMDALFLLIGISGAVAIIAKNTNRQRSDRTNAILHAVHNDLAEGGSLQRVKQKLVNSGVAPEDANKVIWAVCGEKISICKDCDRVYLPSVGSCEECNSALSDTEHVDATEENLMRVLDEPRSGEAKVSKPWSIQEAGTKR